MTGVADGVTPGALRAAALLVAVFTSCACTSPDGVPVPLPNGAPGIGFDDLRYSTALHRILAPAGRSGRLALVDPESRDVTTIVGFSESGQYDGGHDFGATSVDEGDGLLFVTDRTSGRLTVLDSMTHAVLGSARVGAGPDYARFVATTHEVWVTEPGASRIEVFSVPADGDRTPVAAGTIHVDNGPESLVIDASSGRAYTHRWQASTVVIDVTSRHVIAEWPNGCASSRGLAVDEDRQLFFAGCSEGTISVLDIAHEGRLLSSIARGAGFDVIGYNPTLGHLYAAGTACACLVVLGVSRTGALSFLGRFDAPSSAHCAIADDRGHVWVCDPDGGRLLRVTDPYPSSR
jgi:DNA-binding beta-propeller fold protein YncE